MKWMLRLSVEAAIIFVIEMVLSFACTNLFMTGILPQTYTVCVLLALVCLVVTVVLLIVSMILTANKGFAPVDIAVSYLSTFAIFAVVSLFMALVGLEPYFTYMFLGYKVFGFGILSRISSALIVNALICGICVATPVLCNKQIEAERIRRYLQDDNGIDS